MDSMRLHRLFPTAKTAALYLFPIKSYLKNTQGFSILKWVLVEFSAYQFTRFAQHRIPSFVSNQTVLAFYQFSYYVSHV